MPVDSPYGFEEVNHEEGSCVERHGCDCGTGSRNWRILDHKAAHGDGDDTRTVTRGCVCKRVEAEARAHSSGGRLLLWETAEPQSGRNWALIALSEITLVRYKNYFGLWHRFIVCNHGGITVV